MYLKTRDSLDDFKIEMSYNEECKHIDTTILINNKAINYFTDIDALFAFFNKTISRQPTHWKSWNDKWRTSVDSEFYPFTCGCGEAGCAGIWDGVYQKVRGWTVEWKIIDKERNGYHFLDKSFYNFHKMQYNYEIIKAWKWLHKNKHLIVDEYCGREETIGDQLENIYDWIPEQAKILNR